MEARWHDWDMLACEVAKELLHACLHLPWQESEREKETFAQELQRLGEMALNDTKASGWLCSVRVESQHVLASGCPLQAAAPK